jgi:4-diphosphocytidyl-2-C-methyl-D-erythritol kinase
MSGLAVRIAAQAKLNLHLRVLSRVETGSHTLETIFHRIDLADDVVVETRESGRTLDVSGAGTGPLELNLAWKAACAFAAKNEWPRGFDIQLTKHIPVGAGLGGGSADAAAVLRAMNSLAPRPMPMGELMSLAAGLGSDIPFLASDAVMAIAWGRGERMLSLPPLPPRDVVLMTPPFSVSTAEAYRWIDEDAGSASMSQPPAVFEASDLSSWEGIARFAQNDFETVVASRHREVEEYITQLRSSRASLAGMTGSGSAIFAVLDSASAHPELPRELQDRVTMTGTSIDVVPPVRVG